MKRGGEELLDRTRQRHRIPWQRKRVDEPMEKIEVKRERMDAGRKMKLEMRGEEGEVTTRQYQMEEKQ